MASARQFQFFFQLTAALGPNFSKTFKTANSTMTLLGDNLKEVRNKLKDVSAYQKQQTAVERSKQRVTDLEKEHERLQAEYDATGGESEKLKKKLEANTEALAKARDKAADETEKLEEMGQALQEAGVNTDNLAKNTEELAGALGYSVEDMSLGIGLMANASIKAEVAGTSLKTALANMAKPTDAQAAAMEKYGISLTNADGSMKSFGDVVKKLRSSLGGLSEAEQVAAATTIFGKESFAGMLAIVNASEADFNKLTDAVYNCDGAAKQMAETKLDNLNGSITLAQSAFDALQVELGELLLPTLTEGIKKFTEIVNVVTDFVRENPQAVKTIAKVAVALAGLKVGGLAAKLGFLEVKGGILNVQKAFEIIKGIGMNTYLSSLTGGFLNFKNIGSGILGYFTSVKNAAGGVSSALGGVLSNSTLFTKIGSVFSGIGGKIGGTVMGAGSKLLNLFLSPFTRMGGKLGGILSGVGTVIANSPLACKCNHTGKGKYQRIGKTEPTKIRHRTKLGFIK